MISLFEGNTPTRTAETRSNPLENPAVSLASPAAWGWMLSGDPTSAGELINEHSALRILSVYACIRVLAEAIGSLPLKLYEQKDNGRAEAHEQLLHYVLKIEPNPEMSAVTFWETIGGCQALCGNGYAEIRKNAAGQPAALYPLHPLKTKPVRIPTGVIAYETTDGMPNGEKRVIAAESMLHFRLFSWDGLLGLSPIGQAREALGSARAVEKMSGKFFGNSARPTGILFNKGGIRDEKQLAQFRESWNAQNGGSRAMGTAVIPGDWDYKQLTISPDEAQFLETRQFTRADIAGMFRVPPHMIGDTTRLSNSNHEQQSLQFVTDTLRPYLARIENEVHRKLMPSVGRNANKFSVEFDVSERLRGDFQTTMQGYGIGKQWGFYCTNDIRADLGLNNIGPQGDIFYYPINMGNAKALLHPMALLPARAGNKDEDEPEADGPAQKDANPASEPQEGDEPAEQEQRSLMRRYGLAYISMFRDGVGRLCKREKRDFATVSAVFAPILHGLQAEADFRSASRFGLLEGWNKDSERLLTEHMRGIEKRAAKWTHEDADSITGAELKRALKAIFVNTYRAAGAAIVLEGEANATES